MCNLRFYKIIRSKYLIKILIANNYCSFVELDILLHNREYIKDGCI